MFKKLILAGSLVVALNASLFAGGDSWKTNFKEAKTAASKDKKDMILDFTGSDWCHWCIRLNKEVFEKDAFKKYAADKFVLVELDYPKRKKQSPAIKEQNQRLKDVYSISGYPSIYLTDSKGRPYAKTGYQAGGPAKYNEHLEELRSIRIKRDASFAAAAKASGVEKAKHLVSALQGLEEGCQGFYTGVISEIKKLDPNDATGFVKAIELKKQLQALQKSISPLVRSGKVGEAVDKVDGFIADNKLTGELNSTLVN